MLCSNRADQVDITDCQGQELFQLENKLFSWRSTVMGMDRQGNVLFEVKKRNFTCESLPARHQRIYLRLLISLHDSSLHCVRSCRYKRADVQGASH